MPNVATPGSISHGTLREVDLLRAFSNCLASYKGESDLVVEAIQLASLIEDGERSTTSHDVEEVLEILEDELNELAPPLHYFGAHEGDGSDFGFWPLY
jgi:hypothetical protein